MFKDLSTSLEMTVLIVVMTVLIVEITVLIVVITVLIVISTDRRERRNLIMGLKDWIKKKAAQVAEEDKERKMKLERDIIMALRQVYDPEIPVNVYDLGLIYEVKVDDDHNVYIQMTLTAPNCPMADYVVEQVRAAVADVPGVVSVRVDLVWEPEWDKSRMSEEALVELGLDAD